MFATPSGCDSNASTIIVMRILYFAGMAPSRKMCSRCAMYERTNSGSRCWSAWIHGGKVAWAIESSSSELSRERALPERVAHEEGAERLEVLRGLRGLSHGLDEVRERMELAPDEADDEVVVVDVEPVAGEADVVGEVGVAVGATQDAVLADDRALLLGRQPCEGSGAAERIPDGPRPRRVQRRPPRPAQEPLVELCLEAGRVRPAEHRELGLVREARERLGGQELAPGGDEERRVLAHRQHADPARVVDVLIECGLDPARLERADERLLVEAAAERVELHVEPPVGGLLVGAALLDVDLRRVGRAHGLPSSRRYPPRVCISRCGSALRRAIWTSGERSRRARRCSAPRSARRPHPSAIRAASSSGRAPRRKGPRRSTPSWA